MRERKSELESWRGEVRVAAVRSNFRRTETGGSVVEMVGIVSLTSL